jgi:hypothetical protein
LNTGGPICDPFIAVTSAEATLPSAISSSNRFRKAVDTEPLTSSGGSKMAAFSMAVAAGQTT